MATKLGGAMRRRKFITLLGGVAALAPFAARGQQRERMRRVGVLVSTLAADDPEWQARSTAFLLSLHDRGWTADRNVHIDYRYGLGDANRLRAYAAELVALAPDVILAGGGGATEALNHTTRTLPIVF